MMTMLSVIAEFERELIKGQDRRGAPPGARRRQAVRPQAKTVVYHEAEIARRRAEGETLRALAQPYGVTRPAIMRALARAC
jgi:DNA invertase Pin-like site-specific DNA recombinase